MSSQTTPPGSPRGAQNLGDQNTTVNEPRGNSRDNEVKDLTSKTKLNCNFCSTAKSIAAAVLTAFCVAAFFYAASQGKFDLSAAGISQDTAFYTSLAFVTAALGGASYLGVNSCRDHLRQRGDGETNLV